MIKKLCLLFIVVATALTSCSDDPVVVEYDTPADYQPLKIGSWYVYDCDSFAYNDFTDPVTVDTFEFQLMEQITDTFFDLAGNLNYRLERSKRFAIDSVPYDSIPWTHSDVWYVTAKDADIERVEENNRYISLKNPIKEELSWDGNAFNFQEVWDYEYQKVGQSYGDYPNTITVNQILEDQFVIVYQLYEEVYAKDIGMVNRVRIDVESQDLSDPNKPVLERIEKGFQYFQTLNSYYIPQ